MKALIIDDEPMPAKHLEEMIKIHCFEISLTTICNSASKAIDHLKEECYDLIFLDVEMPEMNGFELLEHVNLPSNTEIVFTTAYSQYAVDAFKVNAVHYIMKPVKEEELINAIRKVSKSLLTKKGNENIATISIYNKNEYKVIKLSDIIYVQADGSYSRFTNTKGEIISSNKLGYYEDKLMNYSFIRCHKSYIVNLNQIIGISKGKGGYLTMSNNQIIPISNSHKKELEKLLDL